MKAKTKKKNGRREMRTGVGRFAGTVSRKSVDSIVGAESLPSGQGFEGRSRVRFGRQRVLQQSLRLHSPVRTSVSLLLLAGKRNAAVVPQLGNLFGYEPDQKDQDSEYNEHLGGRTVSAVKHKNFEEAIADSNQKGEQTGRKENLHRRKQCGYFENDQKEARSVLQKLDFAFGACRAPWAFYRIVSEAVA